MHHTRFAPRLAPSLAPSLPPSLAPGLALLPALMLALLAVVLLTSPAIAANWYEGGTLHSATVSGWLKATGQNQLATAADFVAATTDPAQLRAQSPDALRTATQAAADCVTTFAETGVFDSRMTVKEAVLFCLKDSQKTYPFFLSKAGADPERAAPAEKVANAATAPIVTETPMTADRLRSAVKALLQELDSFRNTSTFRGCIYGCGSRNPGAAWEAKRKALDAQVTPQLDAPLLLKTTPADLWSLGMAYGRNNHAEAKRLRAHIEEGLVVK
ncbi:hypothetical protein [Megalodesulfovibrio paquesii]